MNLNALVCLNFDKNNLSVKDLGKTEKTTKDNIRYVSMMYPRLRLVNLWYRGQESKVSIDFKQHVSIGMRFDTWTLWVPIVISNE